MTSLESVDIIEQELNKLIGFKDHNPNEITKETVNIARHILYKSLDFKDWLKYNDCYPYGDGSIKLEYQLSEGNFIDINVHPNNTFDIEHEIVDGFVHATIFEKYNVTIEEVIDYLNNIQKYYERGI